MNETILPFFVGMMFCPGCNYLEKEKDVLPYYNHTLSRVS